MRLYVTSRPPDLRSGLLGLLLAALDAEPSDVWLVSPWLRDIPLPISDQGHFASVFGGHRDEARMSEVLVRLAEQHTVQIVTKPPHELVSLATVGRIARLLDAHDALLREDEVRDFESVESALAWQSEETGTLGREVTRHAEMFSMLDVLSENGIRIHVLENLHAKLLWTPAGAVLGSANFTHGGLGANQELMAEVSDGEQLAQLRSAAAIFAARGIELTSYSLTPALDGIGMTGDGFRALSGRFARHHVLHAVSGLVESLAVYVR